MDALPLDKLPLHAKLLSSIWSYRRKRLPNRDYWETYAPVAAWSMIRLLLYMATMLNLSTRQVDYTSAFPQADLDVPVFMKVPQGWFVSPDGTLHHHDDPRFNDTKHFLKLKKNLYGCKQAARNWFRMRPSERRVCAILHRFLSFPSF